MKKIIHAKYTKIIFVAIGIVVALSVILLAARLIKDLFPVDAPLASPVAEEVLLTIDVVAKHNTKESCYTIVVDKVYDLTTWIGRHPGGAQAIEKLCGQDATSEFKTKHNMQAGPQGALDALFIGQLEP